MKVYPSLLSCDFGRLREEAQAVEKAGADGLHIDVMDGHFVPNLTLGPPILKKVSADLRGPIDCHLMVSNPDALIEDFVRAGAHIISVHQEACPHLQRTLRHIRDLGCKAGVALNPATSFESLEWVLDDLDLVLSMTVNPGFGGQKLIPAALAKTARLAKWLEEKNVRPKIEIQIDGGVTKDNIAQIAAADVDIVVAGTAVFGEADYAKAIAELKNPK